MTTTKLFPPRSATRSSAHDVARLKPHMASSGKLNELLVMDTVTVEDLRRMVFIEANSPKPRNTIVRKLLGRIATRERKHVLDAIATRK